MTQEATIDSLSWKSIPQGDWVLEARCGSVETPDHFFIDGAIGIEQAKKFCESCPVTDDCLQYALDNRIDHGVWGATSPRDRRSRRGTLLTTLQRRRENEQRLEELF